jgi:hypothetical protein
VGKQYGKTEAAKRWKFSLYFSGRWLLNFSSISYNKAVFCVVLFTRGLSFINEV